MNNQGTKKLSDLSIKKLIAHIRKIIRSEVDERVANAAFIKPAVIESVSDDGLTVSVSMLSDGSIIENVENYNSRKVTKGMACYVAHWGAANRFNNRAVLFGGTERDSVSPLSVYPIGSIYMSVNNVNPSVLFGGTWVAWGEGKAVVGVGTGVFAGVETQTGALDHLHSQTNHIHVQTVHAHGMQNHQHFFDHTHHAGAHTHALNDSGQAQVVLWGSQTRVRRITPGFTSNHRIAGNTDTVENYNNSLSIGVQGSTGGMNSGGETSWAWHRTWTDGPNHANTANSAAANTGNVVTAVNTGTTSTVQPSITCYMWKRTA